MEGSPISSVNDAALQPVPNTASEPNVPTTAVNVQQDTVALSATAQALRLYVHGSSIEAIAAALSITPAMVDSYLDIPPEPLSIVGS